ncbi:SinI family restriction endonuclease [Anabaena sp. FACHB-709]|uniref:Type II site-specific deoxyribonuclease n=3 Tax=Nostocaceae TaxID=1162 RepID=A0ACD6B950_NOSS1|nr:MULTISPECIES: SinI family restriction endonuclease [Nostocaceae]BAB72890.1 type II site-specific deoxyribonuclease [Nostoc sp. PCC 7120 = FACHB-418]
MMSKFIQNAAEIAKKAMDSVDPSLSEKFTIVIRFLTDNPDAASALKGKERSIVGTEEYIIASATNFKKGRDPRTPLPPSTIPDEMVSVILNKYFEVPSEELEKAEEWHRLSMGAENIVGDLLERYIAEVIEPHGWIWCSGSMVRAVDFIYCDSENVWQSLQVKNRDNTENSSSAAIRHGTPIKKWFRTFSKKRGDNWDKFPSLEGKENLSEKGFKLYVEKYLSALRAIKA